MSQCKKALFCLVVSLFPVCVWGQVSARVAGLESNPKYMSLLLQEKQLKHTEDSVVHVISEARKQFASATTERERYGKEILRLEGELFDVRNHLGEVGSAITAIEQDYIVTHMNAQPSVAAPLPPAVKESVKKQVANLVYNDYFRDNLASGDYASLCRSQQMEMLPPTLLSAYLDNYHQMEALSSTYSTAARSEAEEAYAKLKALKGINTTLADSITRVWNYIYDNKTYAYNYLLDKMNKNGLLNDFELQFKETNQLIASARDKMASDVVYGYPLRKKLILSYEVALADVLGYTQAHDSLVKVLKAVDALSYNLPVIDPQPRNFIDYSNIEVTTPSKYNASHPIPANEVFMYGTVYKVQIGTFTRLQPVSVFRGVSPLSYEKLEDGRYRYFAGAFRELSEAQAALTQLTKLGFRKPLVAVWRDGVFESLGEESPAVGQSASDKQEAFYRVEIAGEAEEMSEAVKEIITSVAQDKEVSRAAAPDGGYIYTVGSFDNRDAADRLAELLGAVEGVTAKVLELKN